MQNLRHVMTPSHCETTSPQLPAQKSVMCDSSGGKTECPFVIRFFLAGPVGPPIFCWAPPGWTVEQCWGESGVDTWTHSRIIARTWGARAMAWGRTSYKQSTYNTGWPFYLLWTVEVMEHRKYHDVAGSGLPWWDVGCRRRIVPCPTPWES